MQDTHAQFKVLVVDDDKFLAQVTARQLSLEADFEVTVAGASAPALIRAKKSHFDVVVSDVFMPGMSGLELIRALRAFDLDVPVVLLTGTPALEDAQRAVELGAYRYLVKPVKTEDLIPLVRQAATNHRLALLKRKVAKKFGKMDQTPGDRAGLGETIDSALATIRFAHQPIVKSVDGSIYGYESFIRCDNERLPGPMELIDACVELNRLHDVTKAVVLDTRLSLQATKSRMFVNILPGELTSPDLSDLLSVKGNERIVFELSDNERFDQSKELQEKIGEFNRAGIEVAVDDLGVGRAGLGNLGAISPLYAKIDMSIISGVDTDTDKHDIVCELVSLCHAQGFIVMAEGIESAGELETCIALEVDLLQGYYIARPAFGFPEVNAETLDCFERTQHQSSQAR